MKLMTDPVPGFGIEDAVFVRYRLQETMVIRIAESYLKTVVIHVADR
jgi:hypothetical protein